MKFNVTGETVSSLICCREPKVCRCCFQLNLRARAKRKEALSEKMQQLKETAASVILKRSSPTFPKCPDKAHNFSDAIHKVCHMQEEGNPKLDTNFDRTATKLDNLATIKVKNDSRKIIVMHKSLHQITSISKPLKIQNLSTGSQANKSKFNILIETCKNEQQPKRRRHMKLLKFDHQLIQVP